MKKRINLQFMVLTLATILATVSLSTVVFYRLFKKEVFSDLKTYTELMVEANAWGIIKNPEVSNVEEITEEIEELRVTLILPDGKAIFDSNANIGSMENHSERPEIADAFLNGEGKAIRKSATLGRSAFYYAVKLDNGGVLRVAKETGSIISVFMSAMPIIGVICMVLFILCIVLAHSLTKSIIQPIEHLAENLDAPDSVHVYKELVPFVTTIRRQHEDIMKSANVRQEFTANVSHELKTPLTSISGYSELIESGMATERDIVRFAAEIHKSSNRLLTLINDIIRLSELDQSASEELFEDINLYEVARNCVDMLQMSAEKHQVKLSLSGTPQIIYASRQMMEELIYNLCDNAIRYNNPGGMVEVTVTRQEGKVAVQVSDTGIGIPKEHQERIFERFYRVDKSRSKSTGGTGLGLAIVKHIVARHEKAHLELESEVGRGTVIRVLFDV